jgi:serine/threonine protein kinase/Tol biopolymer transport system component
MSTPAWSELEALFHEAQAHAPADRAAWLAARCAGRPKLHAELEAMLRAHDEGASALHGSSRGTQSALKVGTRVGAYEIVGELGAGGMGEVYRARDSRLRREVAIKILPAAFTADADRVARFEREARVLASLNHPNIAAIYGIEEGSADAGHHLRALVLELVEGETLADRIVRGPVPVAEVLTVARQVAEALEAAHEKGIVHRDLKPANIKIAPNGTVKVLDFGLAKVAAGDGADSQAPTATLDRTREGVIAGTAAYMSPEQARGQAVDKRSDIWAFGCVLYEMLTGCAAFPGDTISDTIAAILQSEPDWDALPDRVSEGIRRLLQRCLKKDLKFRLRDIGDAHAEIDEELAAPTPPSPKRTMRTVPLIGAALTVFMVAILVGAGVWFLKRPSPSALQSTVSLVVALPPGEQLVVPAAMVAFSSDGTHLAYTAQRSGTSRLYVRAMDRQEAEPVPETEGATAPFFSPDGTWIGFFAAGKLKKVPIAGGAAVTLSDAAAGKGGSWASDDTIFFSPQATSGLWRVSASGGTSHPVTTLDREKGEVNHRWPQLLPDGRALLFTVSKGPGEDEQHVELQVLATGERRVLIETGRVGRYVPTGHLVYLRAGRLLAVPFDPVRLEVTAGAPVALVENVWDWEQSSAYAVSDTGSLAYLPGAAWQMNDLVWVDRSGKTSPVGTSPGLYCHPRLSPDGRQVAIQVMGPTEDIWIYDLARTTSTRLTTEEGSAQRPVWTPDGARVTYRLSRAGYRNLFWKMADGSGLEQQLTRSEEYETPDSWSPDGRILTFSRDGPKTGSDVWTLRADGTGMADPFLQTPFSEGLSRVAPDGRWVAYVSNESGRNEVYVRPFPDHGGKWPISTQGGNNPVWARNARELFYRSGNQMMVVDINAQPTFTASKPRVLFEGLYEAGPDTNYDVTRDGQRFLMVKRVEQPAPAVQLNVILSWSRELQRRVSSKR